MRFGLMFFFSFFLLSFSCEQSDSEPTQQLSYPQTFVLSNNIDLGESYFRVIDGQGNVQTISNTGAFSGLTDAVADELSDLISDFPFDKIELLDETSLRLYLSIPIDGVSDTVFTHIMENDIIRVELDASGDDNFEVQYDVSEQQLIYHLSSLVYSKKDVNTNEIFYSPIDIVNERVTSIDDYLQQRSEELNLTEGDTIALNLSGFIYE